MGVAWMIFAITGGILFESSTPGSNMACAACAIGSWALAGIRMNALKADHNAKLLKEVGGYLQSLLEKQSDEDRTRN